MAVAKKDKVAPVIIKEVPKESDIVKEAPKVTAAPKKVSRESRVIPRNDEERFTHNGMIYSAMKEMKEYTLPKNVAEGLKGLIDVDGKIRFNVKDI